MVVAAGQEGAGLTRTFEGDPALKERFLSGSTSRRRRPCVPDDRAQRFGFLYDPAAGMIRLTREMRTRLDIPDAETFTRQLETLHRIGEANRRAQERPAVSDLEWRGGLRPFPSAARRPSASIASPRRTPTSPPGRRRMAPGSMSARSSRRGRRVPKTTSRCARRTGRPPSCASPSARSSRIPGEALVAPGERVSAAMRAGHELAKTEGPLHPGTMPQYPVPSESHAGAVAVPLPILAVDAGQRGLFAPPRIAVVRWPSAEPVGVGDAPGFDPERWPPPRLGDWPPPAVRDWPTLPAGGNDRALQRDLGPPPRRLVLRRGISPARRREARGPPAAGAARSQGMLEFYADISPRFWAWLTA